MSYGPKEVENANRDEQERDGPARLDEPIDRATGPATTQEPRVGGGSATRFGAGSSRWGELLTAEEVASYLKCHVSTVYDLSNSGRLKAFSLTGHTNKNKRGKKGLRILASSVDELVATGLSEREQARPVRPEPQPALLPQPRSTARRARSAGSRVTLPYPGQSC